MLKILCFGGGFAVLRLPSCPRPRQVIPLIFLTLVVRQSCLSLFTRPLHLQSVRAAVDLDNLDQVQPSAQSWSCAAALLSCAPRMRTSSAHQEPLRDAIRRKEPARVTEGVELAGPIPAPV